MYIITLYNTPGLNRKVDVQVASYRPYTSVRIITIILENDVKKGYISQTSLSEQLA